jgi:polyisoprenoid-binding protein YceI
LRSSLCSTWWSDGSAGRFSKTAGTITIADDTLRSSIEVRIETASIDTQNGVRDADLKSPRFLDVDAFPLMTHRGTSVVAQLDGRWSVAGELTVRDVTRPVALDGLFAGAMADASGATRIAFEATASISRTEFGLTTELAKESGGILLGRDVSIEINAEALSATGT